MYGNANYKLTTYQIVNVGQWKCCSIRRIYTVAKYKERFLEVSGPSMQHTRPFLDKPRMDGNRTVPFPLEQFLWGSQALTSDSPRGFSCLYGSLCQHPPPLPRIASQDQVLSPPQLSWERGIILFLVCLPENQAILFLPSHASTQRLNYQPYPQWSCNSQADRFTERQLKNHRHLR